MDRMSYRPISIGKVLKIRRRKMTRHRQRKRRKKGRTRKRRRRLNKSLQSPFVMCLRQTPRKKTSSLRVPYQPFPGCWSKMRRS